MNEFNRNENDMNENLPNELPENDMNNAENANDETAEMPGNDHTIPADDQSVNEETAPMAENHAEYRGEERPAEGTYSYTRGNIPNPTYRPNDPYGRPQMNQPQNNPYGAYGYRPQT